LKMFLLRIVSAIGIVFLIYQFSQDVENINTLSTGTGDLMDDFFNWGNDRFVMGKIGDGKNVTKKKKSNHEIFMEAILEGDTEEKEELNKILNVEEKLAEEQE
jgi:hypothetical protein